MWPATKPTFDLSNANSDKDYEKKLKSGARTLDTYFRASAMTTH